MIDLLCGIETKRKPMISPKQFIKQKEGAALGTILPDPQPAMATAAPGSCGPSLGPLIVSSCVCISPAGRRREHPGETSCSQETNPDTSGPFGPHKAYSRTGSSRVHVNVPANPLAPGRLCASFQVLIQLVLAALSQVFTRFIMEIPGSVDLPAFYVLWPPRAQPGCASSRSYDEQSL